MLKTKSERYRYSAYLYNKSNTIPVKIHSRITLRNSGTKGEFYLQFTIDNKQEVQHITLGRNEVKQFTTTIDSRSGKHLTHQCSWNIKPSKKDSNWIKWGKVSAKVTIKVFKRARR